MVLSLISTLDTQSFNFSKPTSLNPNKPLNPKPPTSYLAAVPEVVVADAVLTVVEDVVLLHTGIYKGFLKGIYTV